MAKILGSTQTSLRQRLSARARQCWPELVDVHVRYRGGFACLDGTLAGGQRLKLCRLRYAGYANMWGFAMYRAGHDDYQDSFLPTGSTAGTAEDALDTACNLYLTDPTPLDPTPDEPTKMPTGAPPAARRAPSAVARASPPVMQGSAWGRQVQQGGHRRGLPAPEDRDGSPGAHVGAGDRGAGLTSISSVRRTVPGDVPDEGGTRAGRDGEWRTHHARRF